MKLLRIASGADPENVRWTLTWEPLEASIILRLPVELVGLLADPEHNRRVIDRLFPCSYSDPREQEQHRLLLGESLFDARHQMLTEVTDLFDAATYGGNGSCELKLDASQLDLLMRFFNDVRLVLATDLGIEKSLEEERLPPNHPDAPRRALLDYLGHVQAILVEAVSKEL